MFLYLKEGTNFFLPEWLRMFVYSWSVVIYGVISPRGASVVVKYSVKTKNDLAAVHPSTFTHHAHACAAASSSTFAHKSTSLEGQSVALGCREVQKAPWAQHLLHPLCQLSAVKWRCLHHCARGHLRHIFSQDWNETWRGEPLRASRLCLLGAIFVRPWKTFVQHL